MEPAAKRTGMHFSCANMQSLESPPVQSSVIKKREDFVDAAAEFVKMLILPAQCFIWKTVGTGPRVLEIVLRSSFQPGVLRLV